MSNVYVFGHKNPDNDSICSASAYAEYLNDINAAASDDDYVAARLGDIPPESRWVFEQFEVVDKLPLLLPKEDTEAGPFSVVLVDHNEYAQSADGIEHMNIIGIMDHHRIGDIRTAAPISFINLPYGSTATIVARQFIDAAMALPPWIAGVLLSALLTDTVILKSPTTTKIDVELCNMLAEGLKLNPVDFGMTLFEKRSEAAPFTPAHALTTDLKEYDKDGMIIGIVQYETVSLDEITRQRDAVLAEMKRLAESRGWDLFVFMATDIIKEGTELFVVGETAFAEAAFKADFSEGSAWLPGVLSRKKQVAAALMDTPVSAAKTRV